MDQEHFTNEEVLRLLFKGKWRLKVIAEILKGPVRLSHLKRAIPWCSKKVLIDTLHDLEALGWIEREDLSSKRKLVLYSTSAHWDSTLRSLVAALARHPVDGSL